MGLDAWAPAKIQALMALRWTQLAKADLERIHSFLEPVSSVAALRAVRLVLATVRRVPRHPRIGVRLPQFGPREVRRLLVSDYEVRYEISGTEIIILRVWHLREDR